MFRVWEWLRKSGWKSRMAFDSCVRLRISRSRKPTNHQGRLLHGDQLRRGGAGPDPRELPTKELRTRDIHSPDLRIDTIKMKTREFR
jgi:hypothetical protein